jgi:hypothetical protein
VPSQQIVGATSYAECADRARFARATLQGSFAVGAVVRHREARSRLTPKKTQSESAVATATKARGAAARAVGSVQRPVLAHAAAAPKVVKDDATTEGVLARVIRLSQATLTSKAPPSKAPPAELRDAEAPVDAGVAVTSEQQPNEARASLEKALESLDSEVALKLRTLMIAGRDGKSIGDVNVNLTLDDSKAAFAAAAVDTSQNGPLLADYLRRGHALACATALDLERPLASWSSAASHTLDERAWLSFGKQLAKAELDDWQCLAFVEANQAITRLYLRLQGHAWWSFQAVLDRPSAASVEKHERTLSSRRSKGLATRSLSSLVSRLASTEGRALRRAARAIRARVGDSIAT